MIIITIEFFKALFPRFNYGSDVQKKQIPEIFIEQLIEESIIQFKFFLQNSGYNITEKTPELNIKLYICYKVASLLVTQYEGVDSTYLTFLDNKWKEFYSLGMKDLSKILEDKPKTAFSVSSKRQQLIP